MGVYEQAPPIREISPSQPDNIQASLEFRLGFTIQLVLYLDRGLVRWVALCFVVLRVSASQGLGEVLNVSNEAPQNA